MINLGLFKLMTILTICLWSIVINAAVPAWQIVPAKSSLTFTGTQNNAPVKGSFKIFSGQINFDTAQLEASSVEVKVNMASVMLAYSEIANNLKGPEWFNVSAYPLAIFKSNAFSRKDNTTYLAEGTLSLRDKSLPVTLAFVIEEYSNAKMLIKGEATLKRTQFGVGQGEWAKTDEIKDDVQVNFIIEAVKVAPVGGKTNVQN